MTCLAPLALIGVLLLILPIAVHLFKPRKMKQTPFSSLRWLKQTHQRLSRRIQWHQWLLFLMRAACILLLVIALAKPLIGSWGSGRAVDRFIILDTSRSMAYQASEGPAPIKKATDLASQLVQSARPSDRTAVIVAGTTPRLIAPPSADPSAALPLLKAIEAGQADLSLSAVLPLVRSQLTRQKDRDVELVFLTDNLKQRWRQDDVQSFLKDLPNTVRVKIIDTSAGAGHNAWIVGARFLQFGDGDDRWIRAEVACNSESNVPRSVRLTGITGFAEVTQPVTLKPGQLSRVDFRLPASLNLQEQVAQLHLVPTDALPSDDVFYVNLDAGFALRVLLIEPENPGPDGRNVGLYLQAALKALSEAKNQSLDVATRSSASVTASDVQKADVVLFAGAPDLPDAALQAVEARVRAGAGLALFLGPQLKTDFANQKLYRAQQPVEGLLPMSITNVTESKTGALTNVRWTHPLLTSLQDPVLSDLTQSRFRTYANLTGASKVGVLARFDDDVPALIDHPLGAGRVLIFNTSANDEWSDLTRRKSFLPLVDKTLSHLSAGGVKKSFTVGDTVLLPLPDYQTKNVVTVTAPSGAKLPVRLIAQRGQTILHLDEIAEAGAYRVEGAGKKDALFVVNAPRIDSPLNVMEQPVLEDWWSPATVEITQQISAPSSIWPLWPMFVLFAGMLLVAETVYVHVLCPRANPKAAEAVVPQRGVLKPVTQKTTTN